MLERRGAALEGEAGEAAAAECRVCALCGSEFKIMGLYNRLCKRFFAAVIIRLIAQSDSRALRRPVFPPPLQSDGVYVPVTETFENRSAKQNQESSAIAHWKPSAQHALKPARQQESSAAASSHRTAVQQSSSPHRPSRWRRPLLLWIARLEQLRRRTRQDGGDRCCSG